MEIRLSGFGAACTAVTEYGIQKTWTKIEVNQDNEKQLVAILLMAFSTGKASMFIAEMPPTRSNCGRQSLSQTFEMPNQAIHATCEDARA